MKQLNTRQLGRSEMYISPVGIGTAPIASTPEWRIYWGPQDEADSIRAIHAALDRGVNWIDTAPFYGWGRGERIVGKAVKGNRDRVLIFTKCGTLPDAKGGWYETLKPENIRREVVASLQNLQTDYIDLYQFHDPDPETRIEDSWAEMQKLIDEGKVRYGGLSNHPVELMQRATSVASVTSVQHQYNLLYRDIEQDVLPYSQQNDIGVLAWGPLASGFLTDGFDVDSLHPDDFRRRHPNAQKPILAGINRLRGAMEAIASDHGKSIVDLAIAWILRQPGVTGAIIGIRNQQEAMRMLGGIDWTLTTEQLSSLDHALGDWQHLLE